MSDQKSTLPMSRRSLVALTGAAAALAVQGAGSSVRAQGQPAAAKPLTIGILNDSSAFTADLSGIGAHVAGDLAVEDFGGTVLGRPISLIKADHQAKPDLGVSLARRMYDEGVAAIFDIGITTVAISVQQLAREKNRIAVFTSTGTVDMTRALCSPNGIHWAYDSYSVAVGAARANMQVFKKSKWFFMTVDYAYGHSLQAEATKFITANGGTVIGSAPHPLSTQDFSSDLLKAQASGAELIALATPTPLIANIVKQAAEYRVAQSGQRLAPVGLFSNDVKGIGLALAQDLLITEPFYWDQNDATRAFSKRFFDKFRKMPNSLQASVYGAVTHYLKAVKAAGTDETGAVMAAMKAMPVNDFMTKDGTIRADGRLVRDMHVFRAKSPAESKGEWDLYEQLSTIPGPLAFSPPDAACKLI